MHMLARVSIPHMFVPGGFQRAVILTLDDIPGGVYAGTCTLVKQPAGIKTTSPNDHIEPQPRPSRLLKFETILGS